MRSDLTACSHVVSLPAGARGDEALADPTRRTILDELVDRNGQTLVEICARLAMKHGFSSTRQPISQHLDVLEAAGLVTTRSRSMPARSRPPCSTTPAATSSRSPP
jgi:DNA-binding transcriptional ArsR family regulator